MSKEEKKKKSKRNWGQNQAEYLAALEDKQVTVVFADGKALKGELIGVDTYELFIKPIQRAGSDDQQRRYQVEVRRPLAEAVADQLQAIGIEATVRLWERPVVRPRLLAGERTAFLDGWGDSAFGPVGHFEAKWHGYVEDQPYGRGNYSGYDNERVNELIRMGEITADPAERQRIYDEAQEIIYEEAPAVFLVLPEQIKAASVRIQNWELASDGRINLHDVCAGP